MKIFGLILILLATLPAFAKEGFWRDRSALPASLQGAWDSTFFIFGTTFKESDATETGSAFLIQKETVGARSTLYFLTSSHIVKKICDISGGFCKQLYVAPHLGLNDETLDPIGSSDGFIHGLEIVRQSDSPDLTLLKVTVDQTAYEKFKPIPFASDCAVSADQEIFAIGFPSLYLRSSLQVKDRFEQVKRWSQGIVVGDLTLTLENQYFTPVTADALEGNSGGPALTREGRFFGVLERSASTDKNGHIYTGREGSTIDWQTLASECEDTREFLNPSKLPGSNAP